MICIQRLRWQDVQQNEVNKSGCLSQVAVGRRERSADVGLACARIPFEFITFERIDGRTEWPKKDNQQRLRSATHQDGPDDEHPQCNLLCRTTRAMQSNIVWPITYTA